jgi:hypothetical protein
VVEEEEGEVVEEEGGGGGGVRGRSGRAEAAGGPGRLERARGKGLIRERVLSATSTPLPARRRKSPGSGVRAAKPSCKQVASLALACLCNCEPMGGGDAARLKEDRGGGAGQAVRRRGAVRGATTPRVPGSATALTVRITRIHSHDDTKERV